MGHSFICLAALRAEDHPGGQNLGFSVRINWRGHRGLRWAQVLLEVVSISHNVQVPVVLEEAISSALILIFCPV